MNHSFKAAVLLTLSFAACAPAYADTGLAARAASAMGSVIAAQGNAALSQIRQELKETLRGQLKPFLPAAAPVPQPAPAKR